MALRKRRKKRMPDKHAPTSVRVSPEIKKFLREEGIRERKIEGGEKRTIHFMLVRCVRDWIRDKLMGRGEAERVELILNPPPPPPAPPPPPDPPKYYSVRPIPGPFASPALSTVTPPT